NTLANQILNKYVAWERPSGKLGLIPMPRPLVKEIFRDIPNKRIQRVARNSCKDTIKELVLIKEGNLTLDSFISVFNEWLRASWLVHRYKKNIDRKSTRLNSSHGSISYAVFCLKKKRTNMKLIDVLKAVHTTTRAT